MNEKRGMLLSVYKGSQDFSDGGISSRCNKVTLVGPGVPELFIPDEQAPAVKLVVRQVGNEVVIHATPFDSLPGDHMNGGAVVGTSDSRFGDLLKSLGYQPYCCIYLHDRKE
jgi:hypothetical protein